MEPTFDVLESIERQAASCAHIGSALYASLLRGLADDYRSGGITAELLDGVSDQPQHDALSFRYLAVAHRLALTGDAPTLAHHYPSSGGAWSGDDITADFLSVVGEHRDEFVQGVRRNVQTNEVGRAAPLAAGFSLIAATTALPLRTLEIGCSAGLLSQWPHYFFDTGVSVCGDPIAAVRFDSTWFAAPPPRLIEAIEIVERRASDVCPIDVCTPEGQHLLLSFVWPDQDERIARLRAAIDTAQMHPLHVEQSDAGQWLGEQLNGDLPVGVATVVFHAIVWQYLPKVTRGAVRSALADAGARCSTRSPNFWLRNEPATAERADLRLTTWPGGVEQVLASVGYHGAGLMWNSGN